MISRLPRPHLIGAILVLAALLLSATIGNTEHPVSNDLAHAVSNPLNATFLSLGILGLLCLALADRSKACAKRVAAVMLLVTLIVHTVKFLTGHLFLLLPRPSGGGGGFPSGHAAAACALAFLLTMRMPRLAPLWYALAALISWSRVEAGAHYPYQIIGGAALGMVVALVFSRRFPPAEESNLQTGGVPVGARVRADR